MQHCQIVPPSFLEPGKDTAVVLDFAKKTFDPIALFIKLPVIFTGLLTVGLWWDNDFNLSLQQSCDQCIRVVGFVSRYGFCLNFGQ